MQGKLREPFDWIMIIHIHRPGSVARVVAVHNDMYCESVELARMTNTGSQKEVKP